MENSANARVARWTQKLLDLSLRNRLLNARDSRLLLPLAVEDVAGVEDRLRRNESLPVAPAGAAAAGALPSALPPDDTRRRLKELYRVARTGLEESGVNALFVAVGFLRWRVNGADRDYRAPLLMLPVSLTRRSMAEGYRVAATDEDEEVNATLVEFLRAEHGIRVEGVDPPPDDGSGIDVAAVMKSFADAVAGREGWGVEPAAALGYFSFGKFAMWKALSAQADRLAAHPLVAHLMGGGGGYDDGVAAFDADSVAEHVKYGELFCPLSADSSQLAAVLCSAAGKSFVLHGPPGTGKSQTIANLITHNLALGRKVLFVSEKKAALDVVHRRLAAVGMGPFCLELHSSRSGKAEVLAQLREALDYADRGTPNEWLPVSDALARRSAGLAAEVTAFHRVQPNGLSAYACFADRVAGGPPPLPISRPCRDMPPAGRAAAREAVAALAVDWRAVDAAAFAALAPVPSFEWSPAAERDAGARLAALARKPALLRGFAALFAGFGLRGFRRDFPAALDRAVAALDRSRGVMRYRASAAAAVRAGCAAFADALERGELDPALAVEAFDRSFAARTLDEILASEPALARFEGLRREELVAEFRRLDDDYAALASHAAAARIADALPRGRGGDCPEGCELGVIRRECAKKARQKPVRRLLDEARGVVTRLKPCFLMSPLSVAQYLRPDAVFDLVVFDEASQIPVWDAVGVIARAKQCVVVGDPRQMPPTNFFQKGDAAEDDEAEEDLESVLDECIAAGLHSMHLNWHYRSRHESLIAFSNHHYYDGRLYTFPAAKTTPSLGVKYRFVEGGVYDAKASRTNRAEAQALVDYVFERLADPAWRRRSVGVVTFSMAQKTLVEDLFEERREREGACDDFFTDDSDEPFFVKNLENVQGDERDVILFSVGYAPGPDGRFLMNFGPLNRAGGERRLNVAVTRAKQQIVVFASCKSAQIDLSRTQAVGAAHLKAFLEYAEGAGAPSAAAGVDAGADAFPDAVAAFLVSKGFSVERRVGCSGYRIDIGVRDPRCADAFMAAVECDGESYAAAATERDRDKQRDSVLRSLGWNTLRVWTADWALDRPRAEARLLAQLEEIGRAQGGATRPSAHETKVTFPRRRAVAGGEQPKVPLEQITNDQLRATMDGVERDLGRCERDTLWRETMRRWGYKTLTPKARARLEGVSRY